VSLYGNELWNGVAGTVFTEELQYLPMNISLNVIKTAKTIM
jgi:hypothetical protein